MAEDIKAEIKNYQTAPFDSHFPNQNGTRNCWQNHLDFHCCEKAMTIKGDDVSMCEWYRCVTSPSAPCPGWHPGYGAEGLATQWYNCQAEGMFPGKIWTGSPLPLLCLLAFSQRGEGGTGYIPPGILDHGLTNNKYLLEKYKAVCVKEPDDWARSWGGNSAWTSKKGFRVIILFCFVFNFYFIKFWPPLLCQTTRVSDYTK